MPLNGSYLPPPSKILAKISAQAFQCFSIGKMYLSQFWIYLLVDEIMSNIIDVILMGLIRLSSVVLVIFFA